uniref:Uncharacterized protein n=1 Tax=Sphaerodactylus townsendi TaxID=933632 RepID=A0ACB8FT25_9SAUR
MVCSRQKSVEATRLSAQKSVPLSSVRLTLKEAFLGFQSARAQLLLDQLLNQPQSFPEEPPFVLEIRSPNQARSKRICPSHYPLCIPAGIGGYFRVSLHRTGQSVRELKLRTRVWGSGWGSGTEGPASPCQTFRA